MTEYWCAICGRAYADRGDRLACCSDRPLFGDAMDSSEGATEVTGDD